MIESPLRLTIEILRLITKIPWLTIEAIPNDRNLQLIQIPAQKLKPVPDDRKNPSPDDRNPLP